MPSDSHNVFTAGPAFDIVELAWADRWGISSEAVEWELLRHRRLAAGDGTSYARRSRDPHDAVVLMEYLARNFDAELFATCPEATRRKWMSAAGDGSVPELLQTLADLLRGMVEQPEPNYDQLPLSRWEAHVRFAHLCGLEASLDGRHATVEEALLAGVESEHPFWCEERIPPIVAEAAQALALCEKYERFGESLRGCLPFATEAHLVAIADHGHAHLAEHHRPWRPAGWEQHTAGA